MMSALSRRARRGALLDVLREDVDLEVDSAIGRGRARGSCGRESRDERDIQARLVDPGDRKRDAVDRDRALLDDVAQQRRIVRRDRDDAGEAVVADRQDPAHTVDMALHRRGMRRWRAWPGSVVPPTLVRTSVARILTHGSLCFDACGRRSNSTLMSPLK